MEAVVFLRNGELLNTVCFKIVSEMPYLFQTLTFSFLFFHLLTVILCELVPLPAETRKRNF